MAAFVILSLSFLWLLKIMKYITRADGDQPDFSQDKFSHRPLFVFYSVLFRDCCQNYILTSCSLRTSTVLHVHITVIWQIFFLEISVTSRYSGTQSVELNKGEVQLSQKISRWASPYYSFLQKFSATDSTIVDMRAPYWTLWYLKFLRKSEFLLVP